MIVLEDLRADARLLMSEPPFALRGVRLNIDPGVTSLVGARGDGGPLLLAVLASRVRAKGGRALIQAQSTSHPDTRRAVGYVPIDAVLPDALTVAASLDLAAQIRGENARPARERLAELGVDHLEKRRVSSLAREEARAVALAEALTSNVKTLLIEEPEVHMDSPTAARVLQRLTERGKKGAFVIVATSSVRTAHALGGAIVRMSGGIATPVPAESAIARKSGARVRVITSDARAFVAAIALDPSATAFSTDGALVSVRGPDRATLAAAIQRAVIAANVDVDVIEPEPAPMEELRVDAAPAMSLPPQRLAAVVPDMPQIPPQTPPPQVSS